MKYLQWACLVTGAMLLCAGICKADDWFCTSQSSARSGNVFKVCGSGYGSSLDVARSNALQSAAYEFKSLRSLDTGIRESSVTVEPKRQECQQTSYGYQCQRLVVFTLSESHADQLESPTSLNYMGSQAVATGTIRPVATTRTTLGQCSNIILRGGNSYESTAKWNLCMDHLYDDE
jgi:hypothetical protein